MSNDDESLHTSDDEDFVAQYFIASSNSIDRTGRSVLKSKENIIKHKTVCSRVLKKKLKKYKLRQDGQEDPDIIDVSQFLSHALKIQYNSKNNGNVDEWTINYLTKMAKKSSKLLKVNGHEVSTKTNLAEKTEINLIKEYDCELQVKAELERDAVNPDKKGDITNNSQTDLPNIENKQESKLPNAPLQMNAFMLMMGARNKSIGCNSPGKEKHEEQSDDENGRKSLKLKRKTKLELMALSKGSKKNKDLEELRDENIKIKMNKRAVRLKNMLSKSPSKQFKDANNISQSESPNIHLNKRQRKYDIDAEKARKRLKTESSEPDIVCIDDDDVELVEESIIKINRLTSNTSEGSVNCNTSRKENVSVVKKVSKSDVEFLSKLSPSIKKKQSVLSYFNKIEKTNEGDSEDEIPSENVIKVKFTPKRKNKTHKKSTVSGQKPVDDIEDFNAQKDINDTFQSPSKNIKSENETKVPVITSNQDLENHIQMNSAAKIKKMKRKTMKIQITEELLMSEDNRNTNGDHVMDKCGEEISCKTERRSKRIIKKPIKYQEATGSDSDDDLVSIEKSKPKKTPNSLKLKKTTSNVDIKDTSIEQPVSNKKQKQFGLGKQVTEPTKLAPIFAPKPQISKADLEARQKFLQSGIPDELKRSIEKQKSFDMGGETFSIVYHIQQKTLSIDNFNPWTLKPVNLNLNPEEIDLSLPQHNDNNSLNLRLEKLPDKVCISRTQTNHKGKLQEMKANYPKFPVYRIFKLLKTKCMPDNTQDSDVEILDKSFDIIENMIDTKLNDPKITVWCDKFRPTCSSDIIGNFEGVSTLKKWLTSWMETNLDRKTQRQRSRSHSSDSSDFFYPSDSDSRDSYKSFDNVLVVTGPTGCGKTSAIYAVATELSIKVIEVNSSAKRTGKIILSNLHEATQSHKVNRGTTNTEGPQESCRSQQKSKKNKQLKTYSKKYGNTQKGSEKTNDAASNSQSSQSDYIRTGMSLILVEDADLVFEQDDGFISALNQIIQTSKRPVILVTSSLTCPHLQRFITNGNVVKFHELSPKMLGMWLDLMCLVENGDVWPNMGQSLLEFCEGDIRKAINKLQLWIATDNSNQEDLASEEILPSSESQDKIAVDDESSAMSWSDQDQRPLLKIKENLNLDTAQLNNLLFKTFISVHDHDIGITRSVLQFPVNHLNIWWNIPRLFGFETKVSDNNSKRSNKVTLRSLARLLDSISVSDIMSAKMRPCLDVTPVSSPWKCNLGDGISDAVDMSPYESLISLGDSMSYSLLTSSISTTQRAFGLKELCVDFTLPGLSKIRAREKTINRHSGLYDCIPYSSQLDRRGLGMDYLSTCREICRIEKDKSDNNLKRNNRFCHYLKSLKVSSSGETLEMLCDSLNSVK